MLTRSTRPAGAALASRQGARRHFGQDFLSAKYRYKIVVWAVNEELDADRFTLAYPAGTLDLDEVVGPFKKVE